MRLIDLPALAGFLETSPVGSDPLWQREAFLIDEAAITLYYARAAGAGRRAAAVEAIDRAQSAAILYAFDHPEGNAQLQGIVLHSPPEQPYFVDEFVDSLIKLRPARRRACLFALELTMEPDKVTTLTFAQARQFNQLTDLCIEILAMQGATRHFKLPYVFWEWATDVIATPLIKLGWSIEQVFECPWPHLQRRYKEMICVNRHADATSFLQLVERR